MQGLAGVARALEREFDRKDRLRESGLRASRDLTRAARAAMQAHHRGEDVAGAISALARGARDLHTLLRSAPDLYYEGFVEDALQEVAEAHVLVSLAETDRVPTPAAIHVTPRAYLLGLADAVGEFRRRALSAAIRGDVPGALASLASMEALYGVLLRFDHPTALAPVKRKQDVARGLLERTRGEVAVTLRSQRMERRMTELSEMLDELEAGRKKTGKKKAKAKKTASDELDIDSVWGR
ncbi:MAG: RNA-binding protein [Methanobacteriota archaeon]